ncbi:MAG: mannose-6-phosphate isomerase [Clostridiaceae bacterium]|nr:mannose-6-phosphate isomerase [Clostridiaceae bacterium]
MSAAIEGLINKPIFFERNRVRRVYKGGKLFGDFFGDEPVDEYQPEEWVASTVRALNKDSTDPLEGLSIVEGTNITFAGLLKQYRESLLGDLKSFDVLVKVLDSAVRLPLQAHPDKEFSRKHFNSNFGKTEMWLILATREDAYICFGFKDKLTKEEFSQAIERGREDKNALSPLLNKVPVKPGEVYLIPAKCVHAIGYGCLILEVQEPTDFTVQPEYWCDDYLLSDYEMYLGLDKSVALDCFDYGLYGPESILRSKKKPRVISDKPGHLHESLISFEDTPCFAVERHTIFNSSVALETAPAIYIVIDGEGSLSGPGYSRQIHKGSYFFLPHCAKNSFLVKTDGKIQLAVCLPPE